MLRARWKRLLILEAEIVLSFASSMGIRNTSCTNRELVIVSEDEDTWDIRFSRELTVWADSTCSDRMLSFMTMS